MSVSGPIQDAAKADISLSDLLDACVQYDREAGDYPESKYEGRALYWFISRRLFHLEPISSNVAEDSDLSDTHWETCLKKEPD